MRPAKPGEIRNPYGRRGKVDRAGSFKAALVVADRLAGDECNLDDPDYVPGRSAWRSLLEFAREEPKEYWTKIFLKTVAPPGEEAADIDFGDTEAAVAVLMAEYIRDPGLFRKVMEKSLESDKLRPLLMDITAQLHVFAVPSEVVDVSRDASLPAQEEEKEEG